MMKRLLPWPLLWPTLRFGAGVASALVFLGTTNWCMGRLMELGQPALGGLIFCGPGLGIVLTGLSASAMVAAGWTAATGWAVFAVLAIGISATVWPSFHHHAGAAAPQAAAALAVAAPGPLAQRSLLALAYGLAGFVD